MVCRLVPPSDRMLEGNIYREVVRRACTRAG
jgi:hypothetical protein